MVLREPKFLSDNLVIFPSTGKGPKYLFIFARSSGPIVEEIADYLRTRLVTPSPTVRERDREAVLQA
jgi:hypothetical protein